MQIKLNAYTVFYLGLRFAPFVIVTLLSGAMIFNLDIRIMIFLVGYLIASLLTILLGEYLAFPIDGSITSQKSCNMMNLTSDVPLSSFPLSLVLYAYSFCYFLFIVYLQPPNIRPEVFFSNLPFVFVLFFLGVFEFTWLLMYCTYWWKLAVSLLIGVASGILWSWLISLTRLAEYQTNTVRKEKCQYSESNANFQCK